MASPRFPQLSPLDMTPAQSAVAERIAAGPRGGLRGPFNAWLRNPELGDLLQQVGALLRFQSPLPARLNELAILLTARFWGAEFEWWAHRRLALDAGLAETIVEDIAAGRRPIGMLPDEDLIWRFCVELRQDRNVSDATYQEAIAAHGEGGVLALIAVSGYYDLVSMTLNVAEVGLPDGVGRQLPPIDPPLPPV